MRKKSEERPRRKLYEVRFIAGSKHSKVMVKGVRTSILHPVVGEGAAATPDTMIWRIEDEHGNSVFEITLDVLISCLVVKQYRKQNTLKVLANGTSGP